MLTGGKWVPASCVIGSTCSSPWVMGQVEEIPPPCCCSEVRTGPRERARVSPRLGSGGVGLQCGALPGGSGERSTDLKGRASQPDPPGTRLLLYSWRNSICPVRAGMAKVDGGGGHLSLTAGGGTQTLLGLDEAHHGPSDLARALRPGEPSWDGGCPMTLLTLVSCPAGIPCPPHRGHPVGTPSKQGYTRRWGLFLRWICHHDSLVGHPRLVLCCV